MTSLGRLGKDIQSWIYHHDASSGSARLIRVNIFKKTIGDLNRQKGLERLVEWSFTVADASRKTEKARYLA